MNTVEKKHSAALLRRLEELADLRANIAEIATSHCTNALDELNVGVDDMQRDRLYSVIRDMV